MLPFKIVQGDAQLSSHSGLALIGAMLDKTNIRERLDKILVPEHKYPEISHGEIAIAMSGLICLGKPDFDAIEPFRDDPFFKQSLGLDSIPSSPTLRQRMDSARGVFNDIILEESAGLVRRFAPVITPCHGKMVPVDIDVSPFDNSKTKKEGVRLTRNSMAMLPSSATWVRKAIWQIWNCVREVTIARKGRRPF